MIPACSELVIISYCAAAFFHYSVVEGVTFSLEASWQSDRSSQERMLGADPAAALFLINDTVPAPGFTMALCVPANTTSSALH